MPELHLTCPVCQTQVDKDYPTHLNSKTQAPLVRDLFEGQLFRFECPTCGAERILYVTDQDQILVDLHQKLIDFVKGKYRKILEEDLRGDFHYIGYRWALDLLEGKKPESRLASDNDK